MQWMCIKEYKPVCCTDLFVRIEMMGMYERYIVASIENLETAEDPETWEIANFNNLQIDLSKYRVTHFAIPDPVEK